MFFNSYQIVYLYQNEFSVSTHDFQQRTVKLNPAGSRVENHAVEIKNYYDGNEMSYRCGTTFCTRWITMFTFETDLVNPVSCYWNHSLDFSLKPSYGIRKYIFCWRIHAHLLRFSSSQYSYSYRLPLLFTPYRVALELSKFSCTYFFFCKNAMLFTSLMFFEYKHIVHCSKQTGRNYQYHVTIVKFCVIGKLSGINSQSRWCSPPHSQSVVFALRHWSHNLLLHHHP